MIRTRILSISARATACLGTARIATPTARDDNLFIASIVALNADTGEYVWHYQEAPGESWDYDADQPMMTADLMIDGAKRHVVMQAPKDGFFYVLDAATGKLISAKAYAKVTWASGIDMATGRPIENPDAKYAGTGKPASFYPSNGGGHNWQPWAMSPATGLVYIPALEAPGTFEDDPNFTPNPKGGNFGTGMPPGLPPPGSADRKAVVADMKGSLLAWDPVKQEARWHVDHVGYWNGGVLATAGNLVVQGVGDGKLEIYRADTGEKLWSSPTQTGVMAGPVSYTTGGEQYIAVAVGWGGVIGIAGGPLGAENGAATQNISRILAFKLGGTAQLPPPPPEPSRVLDPPPQTADAATIAKGQALFGRYCAGCHGPGAEGSSLVPDLRYSARLKDDGWFGVVLEGALQENGMANFSDVLSRDDASAIRDYVISRAHDAQAQGAAQPN